MKVQDLIDKLSKLDPQKDVFVEDTIDVECGIGIFPEWGIYEIEIQEIEEGFLLSPTGKAIE